MKKTILVLMLILVIIIPASVFGAGMADYLLLQDIGPYKLSKPEKAIPGFPPIGGPRTFDGAVVVSGAGHFPDHTDTTYEVEYYDLTEVFASPTVQVTQHAGSGSDKWLLHEVEYSYRDGDDSDGRLGLLSGAGVKIREIGGSKFIYWGLGGGSYTWISGQKVIEIKYTDLQRTKPEPIEVVQAYLQKFPSTIILADTEMKSRAHTEQWLKDEMERRLWLCDKWFAQIIDPDSKLSDKLHEVVRSMNVFLDYREKYYGIAAKDDKTLLDGYKINNNKEAILGKLTEYKKWWSDNKVVAIGLTTIPFSQKVKNWWSQIVGFIKSLFKLIHRFVAA